MDFTLSYGREKLQFDLPEAGFLQELRPREIKPQQSAATLVQAVVQEQFKKQIIAKPTLIIIPDKTRNCGAKEFMPVILDELQKLGVKKNEITFLLANGSHIANQPNEIAHILGQEIAENYTVLQHDAYDQTNLVYMGETGFGTSVYINKNVVEARQILIVGTAIHHYFAGFGGGPKMIVPGCAGYETITKNHALTISREDGGIHPDCRAGFLDNPLQKDFQESLNKIHVNLLIETVLNEKGQVVEVFCGELFATHKKACGFVDEIFKVPVKEKADLVVVSCGGFPKDINFIQAHKSLHNAFQAVKEGGVILMLAECAQGIGSQTFMDWFEWDDYDNLVKELAENYTLNGTTALSVIMKSSRVNIVLCSSLEPTQVQKMGLHPVSTLADGWKKTGQYLPEKFSYYVMPNGSVTLPVKN